MDWNLKIIEKYCLNNGITKLYSPPYNPENNGKAERFNQTLINCARTLLSWSKLDQKFWDYAINYANYLYNINPHRSIGNAIPNEVFFNKKVDLKYIKTFGCIAYYKNFSQNKGKFESNSKKGIFLDLNFRTHCYIAMDYEDLKLHLVREVVFDEDQPANFTLPDENYKEQKASQAIHYFSNDTDIVIENEPHSSSSMAFCSFAIEIFMSWSSLYFRLLILFCISNFLRSGLLVKECFKIFHVWKAVFPCPSIIFLVFSPKLLMIIHFTMTSFLMSRRLVSLSYTKLLLNLSSM